MLYEWVKSTEDEPFTVDSDEGNPNAISKIVININIIIILLLYIYIHTHTTH